MAELCTNRGNRILIDDADAAFIKRWRWKLHPQGYASRTGYIDGSFVTFLMHRVLTGAVSGEHVHHRNGDKLDNRRANLVVMAGVDHLSEHHADHLRQIAKDRQIYPDEKQCVRCGTTFVANPRKRKRQRTCGAYCAQQIRSAAGVAARRAPGMSVVPQVVEAIGRVIMELDAEWR